MKDPVVKIYFLFFLLWGFSVQPLMAQATEKYLRQGNAEYTKEKFEQAEISYRKALEQSPSDFRGQFNLANALYKQGKYEEASQIFDALSSGNPDQEQWSRSRFNLGNSLFKEDKLEESIETYKSILRNNPNDEETRYNLSVALRKLRQQNQPPSGQDQDQGESEQNQDSSKNSSGENPKNQDPKENPSSQNPQEDQGGQDQQPSESQNEKGMSREDAQRLLDVLQDEEKNTQEKLQKQQRAGRRPAIEKNW